MPQVLKHNRSLELIYPVPHSPKIFIHASNSPSQITAVTAAVVRPAGGLFGKSPAPQRGIVQVVTSGARQSAMAHQRGAASHITTPQGCSRLEYHLCDLTAFERHFLRSGALLHGGNVSTVEGPLLM